MEKILELLSPIEIGDGYKDFLVSQIAVTLKDDIAFIRITEDGSAHVFFITRTGIKLYKKYLPISDSDINMTGYTDLRVRYYSDGSNPLWVQAFHGKGLEVDLLT